MNLILQNKTGKKVAIKKEKNSKYWEIIIGNILLGKSIPTNNELEKSGVGKNIRPPISPIIIEK